MKRYFISPALAQRLKRELDIVSVDPTRIFYQGINLEISHAVSGTDILCIDDDVKAPPIEPLRFMQPLMSSPDISSVIKLYIGA